MTPQMLTYGKGRRRTVTAFRTIAAARVLTNGARASREKLSVPSGRSTRSGLALENRNYRGIPRIERHTHPSLLALAGRLRVQPFANIRNLGRSLDGRDPPSPGDQQRAGNISLPGRIDLEPQSLDKAIVKDPVLGRTETRLLQHGAGGGRQIRHEVGADRDHVDRPDGPA